jgi:predicted metalloprotease
MHVPSKWRLTAAAVMATLAVAAAAVGCGPAGGNGPTSSPSAHSTTHTPGPVVTSDGQSLPSSDTQVEAAAPDSALGSGVTGRAMTTDDAAKYLRTVAQSVDEMWSAYFASLPQHSTPDFFYVIVEAGTPYSSQCVNEPVTSTYNNAFFCDKDQETIDNVTYNGSVVLPLDTFMKMWNGDIFQRQSQRTGDFGAAAIVAHEIAHSNWWDLSAAYNLPLINQPDQPKDKNNELLADCGAGLWANTAYYKNYLEAGDVEEAVAALEAIGDAQPGGDDPHGSPAERGAAFMVGYNSGKPGQCIAQYWPGVHGG